MTQFCYVPPVFEIEEQRSVVALISKEEELNLKILKNGGCYLVTH